MKKINWSSKNDDLTNEEIHFISDLLKDLDPLTKGPWIEKFQLKFAKYLNVEEDACFGVTSAASALELISILSELSAGDEIIIPAHTYCASAIPFGRSKLKILWCDIDPHQRVVTLEEIKKKVSKNTKAILVTHLYGLACEMDKIQKFCNEKNIILIEDCAQAIGAEISGRKVGTFGDYSCFSFHAQKNLSTLGEGGMLVVNNEKKQYVKKLKHNGHEPFLDQNNYWEPAMVNVVRPFEDHWPYNFPLTEIQSAIGWKYLDRLDERNSLRKERALRFIESLKGFPVSFQSGFDYSSNRHVWHLFPIKVEKNKTVRNKIINELYEIHDIKCALQFYPLYKYELFKSNGYGNSSCPNLEEFYEKVFSIPFHVWMSSEEENYLITCLKKVLSKYT